MTKNMSRAATADVLAFVLALCFGSLGAATASTLTAHAVKRIAGKVVKKKAKGLTVKNATLLANLPPSAYLDDATVYTAAVTSPTVFVTVTLPLAPGDYVVSYSAFLAGSSGLTSCRLHEGMGPSSFYTADDEGSSPGATAHSGTGLVSVQSSFQVRLECSAASTAFTTTAQEPIQIVVTPIDAVSSSTLTVS